MSPTLVLLNVMSLFILDGHGTTLEAGDIPCLNSTDPLPIVSLVDFRRTVEVNSSVFSDVQFNCTATIPIEWTFAVFPREVDWNVSYIRVAKDVSEESSVRFNSTLNFFDISASEIGQYGAMCRHVGTFCGSPISQDSLLSLDNEYQPKPIVDAEVSASTCSLTLWFDEVSKLYFCSSNNDSVLPRLALSSCSNPTDCGISQKTKCISKRGKKWDRFSCNGRSCTSLRVEGEFPTPKVITCWDGNLGQDASGVDLPGYFHSTKVVNGSSTSSYLNWEEITHPEDDDMITIQVSNDKTLAHEPFDISCVAAYYYFADGMHLTLKHLSDPSFTETDLQNMTNVTLQGTIELNNHGDEIPIRRSLLAEGITLIAGDYQATCYAPVWNSSQWIKKSILISVSDAILPVFLTGNRSRDIEFKPNKNITCLAKGNPPPRLSWVYDNVRVPARNVFETQGSQKSLAWSVITLPANFEGFRIEFKCHAQNTAGFDEKLFIVNKNDESVLVTTKIAAGIIVFGFISNLIVGYFCWKYLFSEEADTAVLKFVRSLRQKTAGMGHHHHDINCDQHPANLKHDHGEETV